MESNADGRRPWNFLNDEFRFLKIPLLGGREVNSASVHGRSRGPILYGNYRPFSPGYFVRFDLIAFFYSLYTFKSHQLANSSLTARNQISVKLRPLQSKTSRVGSQAPAFGPWPGRRPKAYARPVTRREPVKWVKIPQEES